MNGIRDDNRPENLEVVSPSNHEHDTLNKVLRRHIVKLELEIKRLKLAAFRYAE